MVWYSHSFKNFPLFVVIHTVKGLSVVNEGAALVAQQVKNPPAMWEIWVQSLGWEDALEKGKATYSSILAQRIPWTVESMGSQTVGYD